MTFHDSTRTCSIILLALLILTIYPAQAQTFTVLHTFEGTDGATPYAAVFRDTSGNLYGTTSGGGDGKGLCVSFFQGCGTSFEMDAEGNLIWSHSFDFGNGVQPITGLALDSVGNVYGTTYLGGNTKCYQYGCGTVFTVDKTGHKETVLHKFAGNHDGLDPEALLARDAAGNVYGVARVPLGNIFKIGPSGNLHVLHTFTGANDGCVPLGLIMDGRGNLFGVTGAGGGANCSKGYGGVFEFTASGKFRVLHKFNGNDGANPNSLLALDKAGNLYGTTERGGGSNACEGGCGAVFKLSAQGNERWTESVLYSFCSLSDCTDGDGPGEGPLALDASGNIYGTTYFGGKYPCGVGGCGLVYKLDSTGHETVLYNFTGGNDGAYPYSGLAIDKTGTLYGTTEEGGDLSCPVNNPFGCGVVFRLTP